MESHGSPWTTHAVDVTHASHRALTMLGAKFVLTYIIHCSRRAQIGYDPAFARIAGAPINVTYKISRRYESDFSATHSADLSSSS
jgi:hypothetical protein